MAAEHRELLTVAQAAELLQVSDDTIRRRIDSGELPAVQLGGRGRPVRIDRGELETLLG